MAFIVLARDYVPTATWRKVAFAKSLPAGISTALRQKKNLKTGTLYGVLSMDYVSAVDENLLWIGIVWKGRVVEPPNFPIYPFEMASWHRYRTSKKIIALAIDLLGERTLAGVMLECVRLVASMTNSDFVNTTHVFYHLVAFMQAERGGRVERIPRGNQYIPPSGRRLYE